jgi:hypothetical protein
MTTPHPVCSILLALAAAAAAAPKSTVRFANQDVLTGTPESIAPDLLVWKSPLLEESASFHLDKVLELSLPATEPDKPADHEAIVTLTNGDSIRGQLASVDHQTVSLDTWFAGRLDFKRVMVKDVKIEEKTAFLYRGPTGIDGWVQSEESPAWKYERTAFRASAAGGIARENLLTDECVISFDAAWKGDSIRMRVILFSDDVTTDNPSAGYELSFQRGSVHLRNAKTQSFLGSAQSQALMENDRVRVEIRASMKSNRIALTINDRIVEVWNDPDAAKVQPGKALHFISGSPLPLRISKIRVASWDGIIDKMPEPQLGFGMMRFGLPGVSEKPEPRPVIEKDDKERMELANGDTLTGEVTSIQDGNISIKTPLGDVKLPVSRLRTLALKPVEAERTIRRNGDVRAWFPDGSSIVFRLDDCGDGTVTGSSQNFGSATFNLAAFNRIEFNIYSPQYAELRGDGEW